VLKFNLLTFEESLALGEFPKILGFIYNISATAKASDFKIGMRLGFAKAHHNIPHRRKHGRGPGLEKLPKNLGFPCNIYATAEASNFKFGMQLGFVKAHHNIPHQKTWAWPWARETFKYLGFPLIFLQRPRCPFSVSGASCRMCENR